MAMIKALSLPELVENIIVHLPERDILTRAQRVSRSWKTTVDSSPTIQQKIWLRPLWKAVTPSHFHTGASYSSFPHGAPVYPCLTFNNNLVTHFMRWRGPFAGKVSLLFTGAVIGLETIVNSTLYYLRFTQRGKPYVDGSRPSWHAMYVSEPPVMSVLLEFRQYPHQDIQAMVHDKGGITMGHIYDALISMDPDHNTTPELPRRQFRKVAMIGWYHMEDHES